MCKGLHSDRIQGQMMSSEVHDVQRQVQLTFRDKNHNRLYEHKNKLSLVPAHQEEKVLQNL